MQEMETQKYYGDSKVENEDNKHIEDVDAFLKTIRDNDLPNENKDNKDNNQLTIE